MKIQFNLYNGAVITGITPEIRADLVSLEQKHNAPKKIEQKEPKQDKATGRKPKG